MGSNLIIKAAHFAALAHGGQKRKYTVTPYILHPGRVALAVTLWPGVIPEMIAAAWLHDVVEDCGVQLKDIESLFGGTVRRLVFWLTNPSKEHPELSRADRKQMDREHWADAPQIAKIIKLCDRIDNLQEMAGADPAFLALYCDESESLLAESLRGADKPLEDLLRATIENVKAGRPA